jgi:hypothetical protein
MEAVDPNPMLGKMTRLKVQRWSKATKKTPPSPISIHD